MVDRTKPLLKPRNVQTNVNFNFSTRKNMITLALTIEHGERLVHSRGKIIPPHSTWSSLDVYKKVQYNFKRFTVWIHNTKLVHNIDQFQNKTKQNKLTPNAFSFSHNRLILTGFWSLFFWLLLLRFPITIQFIQKIKHWLSKTLNPSLLPSSERSKGSKEITFGKRLWDHKYQQMDFKKNWKNNVSTFNLIQSKKLISPLSFLLIFQY